MLFYVYMNALWISRICSYKNSPNALKTTKRIIELKIQRSSVLLILHKQTPFQPQLNRIKSIQKILLEEARAAKYFWDRFSKLIPAENNFSGRKPRAKDITNTLLDVGYHNLAQKIKSILEQHDCSPAIGLFHAAHQSNSSPLIYDLMECFRSDIVDASVLKFLRLKKRPFQNFNPHSVAIFINRMNKKYRKQHYLKDFHACRSYEYYMELQILKFIYAVNHDKVFKPIILPKRHNTRCS